MATAIIVTCSRCGRDFSPPKSSFLLGTWRKACPACYPPKPEYSARNTQPAAERSAAS